MTCGAITIFHNSTTLVFHVMPVCTLFSQGLSTRIEPFHEFSIKDGHIWYIVHDQFKPVNVISVSVCANMLLINQKC